MTRFSGKVGFGGTSVENPPGSGKYTVAITERTYFGDVINASRQATPGEGVNDRISLENAISIVSDTFAIDSLRMIKYVEWEGGRWAVTSVKTQRPRLILQLGGVYNGPTA